MMIDSGTSVECGDCGGNYRGNHSCIRYLREQIDFLKESKLDRYDDRGREYPSIDKISSIQENALRFMESVVASGGQVTNDVRREVEKMLKHARDSLQVKPLEFTEKRSDFNSRLLQLEEELSETRWMNKIVAGFVVEDYSGSLPQNFLDRFQLRRVPLSVSKDVKGIPFEYPAVKDLLFFPSNIFELREFHGIEWNLQKNGSIRLPRFTFLGNDSEDFIQSPINLKKPKDGHLKQFGMNVIIPEDGVKSVIVRSTPNWVRHIMFVSNEEKRICEISTGVDEGTVQRLDLQEDEEIVGLFGVVDDSHDLKSFGVILFSPV